MFSIEGIIVHSDRQARGRIEIDTATGLITKVTFETGFADVVLRDELIFPGFIDIHVHAREDTSHKDDYKEDFTSAGLAAIHGGVVAFAEMPNNPIPPVDDASYDAKNELAKKSPVPVLLYALAAKGTRPLSKSVPYKAVLGLAFANHIFFSSAEELDEGLSHYRGQSVSFHCEDPKILVECARRLHHEDQRPEEAEISAVDLVLPLIEKHEISGKICHCSTIDAVEKIQRARARGVDVTVEVSPHHLYFDESMLTEENRTMFQVNPPIRHSKENRLALIAALKNGNIDFLATDHAPHSLEEKKKGISGLTHLDTYGHFTTWLMQEHGFSPQDIVRVSALNPASFMRRFTHEKYGEIEEGFVGSLTVIDRDKPTKIEVKDLKTKSGWSPFEGVEFPGKPVITIIRGKMYAN